MTGRRGCDGINFYAVSIIQTGENLRTLKKSDALAESTECMTQRLTLYDEICERVAGLTPAPVAVRILEVLRNERAPIQSLADVINTDALLAARVLKVANFAAGQPQRLLTVSHAIAMMGLDAFKSLAVGLTTFPLQSFPGKTDGSDPDDAPITLRELWEHAIGCAAVAARIATQVDHVSPHQAFAAGFLHDMGRLLMYRCSREGFYTAVTAAAAKSIPLSEAETLAVGMNHVTLGEIWAGRSEVPHGFQQVIRYHHEPSCMLPESLDIELRALIAVVQLADLLCESRAIGRGGDLGIVPSELWKAPCLREESWSDQFKTIKQEIEAAREIFGFPKENLKRTQLIRHPMPKGEPDLIPERQETAVNTPRGRVIPFPPRNESKTEMQKKPSTKKLTILIVEDHDSLCEMLSLYFMRYGYHVRTAYNGETALEILSNEEIHLVLLDLMLPRLDGFAVLKELREKPKDSIPYIIVVSAGASAKDRNKVLERGANEYMPKPFHLMRLLERIQAVEKYLL
jgi:CheY-like chemotaxis protein/HD-like signal output (HDOD) protein